ncbi:MAG: FISUMP domain-containing protein, partial [Bacteroidota bacterium]|nr:FISUMP domain-containing protein [Bacteroidota bacterium]
TPVMILNKKNLALVSILCVTIGTISYSQETGSLTDSRDGHEYKTVKIGDQWWMSENLAYKADKGCLVYEGVDRYLETYGYLYTWETALTVCPEGWHLPSDAEYEKLSNFLGGYAASGGKLKATGTILWESPNTDATNSSGFAALPAGYNGSEAYQVFIGKMAYFWSYDETVEDAEIARALYFNKGEFTRYMIDRSNGLSVRCMKDL